MLSISGTYKIYTELFVSEKKTFLSKLHVVMKLLRSQVLPEPRSDLNCNIAWANMQHIKTLF